MVRPLFERWISNLNQSRTLATLRDTLLPKLLSGELSVGELNHITEAAA
jgi:type I restriction enzyme S subunit